ncbi:hypothetical protein IMZ48_38860 [Candidatus Bathyarchaeota archaeon]|nr:hypothetical protein [Candidatus Bathyarchaeota archaeon]
MVIDSTDYLGATDPSEKDEVAIINTDTPDAETDQLVELPRADDCASSHVSLLYLFPGLMLTRLAQLTL